MSAYITHVANSPINLDTIVRYLSIAAEESPTSNLGIDGTIIGFTLEGTKQELKAMEIHFLHYSQYWTRPVLLERHTVGGLQFLTVRTEIPPIRLKAKQETHAVAHQLFSEVFQLSKIQVRILAASQTNADHAVKIYNGVPYQRTMTQQPCPIRTLDNTNRLAFLQRFDPNHANSKITESLEQMHGYPADRITSMVTIFLKLLCDGKCGAITRENAYLLQLFGRAKITVLLKDLETTTAQFLTFTTERGYKQTHGHWQIRTKDDRILYVTSNYAKDAILSDFNVAPEDLVAMQHGDAYRIRLEGDIIPNRIERW